MSLQLQKWCGRNRRGVSAIPATRFFAPDFLARAKTKLATVFSNLYDDKLLISPEPVDAAF
jgi:hypothetical protein